MSSCTSYTHPSVGAVLTFCRLSRLTYSTFLWLELSLLYMPGRISQAERKVQDNFYLYILIFRLFGGVNYITNRAYDNS